MSTDSESQLPEVSSADLLAVLRATAMNASMTPEEKAWPTVAILAGSTPVIEIIVRTAAEQCGFPMNWGFIAGRAVVGSPGDRAKCRAALAQAIPQTDIRPDEHFA